MTTRDFLRNQEKKMFEEQKPAFLKAITDHDTSLLRKKLEKRIKDKKPIIITQIDKFKKMNFTVKDRNGVPVPHLSNLSISDEVNKIRDLDELDKLFTFVYNAYCDDRITPDMFWAFENLIDRKTF